MINIVLDNSETSNVYPFSITKNKIWHIQKLPLFFYTTEYSIHNSAENLDSFIYPVLVHEPYIQVRSIIMNRSLFGFWHLVPENVIQGLREKRGWIIIDFYSEPITQADLRDVIVSLDEPSDYPNDRVLINMVVPHFVDYKRIFNFPSLLELTCYASHNCKDVFSLGCDCYPPAKYDPKYPHKRFLLLNNHIDYDVGNIFAKYASTFPDSFLDSSGTNPHLLLPQAIRVADLNVVLEAYLDFDVVDYPFNTEKLYRCVNYKKPFVLMGQQYSLSTFRKQGYKTFHPLIDESYDTLVDTTERCKLVLLQLNRLRQMSDDEFTDLLEQCKPILQHNYNNLLNRVKQTNTWLEGLKKV